MAKEYPLDVCFIEMMPIGSWKSLSGKYAGSDTEEPGKYIWCSKAGFRAVRGNGPAVYWEFPEFQGKIGFISAISHKFCKDCNRIRMTAEGFVKPLSAVRTGSGYEIPFKRADG